MRYLTSVAAVCLALIVTLLIWPLVKPMASPLFLAAIIISAWFGGKWVGTLATILTGLVIDFVFIAPQYQLSGAYDYLSRLIVFGIEGFVLCWLIDARQKASSEIKLSREKLRALSTHLQSAVEAERSRISREIHDELGQELTGLRFDVYWMRDQVQSLKGDPNADLVLEKLSGTLARVDSSIRSLRRIATELRPAVLDSLGLEAAIEWQARDFEQRTGITCILETDLDDLAIDSAIATAVFRVFQETLTNVARHSGASEVKVTLTRKNGSLLLQTKDNGIGITGARLNDPHSLGILGMQERIKLLDGEITIDGEQERGTLVEVRIPFRADHY